MNDEKAPEITKKTDCFAYRKETDGCAALTHLYCAREKCNFYKPKGTTLVIK